MHKQKIYFTTKKIAKVGKFFLISDGVRLLHVAIAQQKNFPSLILERAIRHDKLKIFTSVIAEITKYFSGTKKKFSKFYRLQGTPFQVAVWQQVMSIKYGSIASYKDIAYAIKKPLAIRAVALAIAKNPLLLIVPCHRVIGSNNELKGFAAGIGLKKQLIMHEAIYT